MSLDKAIEHGKEHRKPYRGSKAIDYTCRNHGSCPWCERNRRHKFRDKHPYEAKCVQEMIESRGGIGRPLERVTDTPTDDSR